MHARNHPNRQTYESCISYCMVCTSLREDNPRASASRLSPVQAQNHEGVQLCQRFFFFFFFFFGGGGLPAKRHLIGVSLVCH